MDVILLILLHYPCQGIYPTILIVLIRLQIITSAGLLSQGIINQDLSMFAVAAPQARVTHLSFLRPQTGRDFGTFSTVASIELVDVERQPHRNDHTDSLSSHDDGEFGR